MHLLAYLLFLDPFSWCGVSEGSSIMLGIDLSDVCEIFAVVAF